MLGVAAAWLIKLLDSAASQLVDRKSNSCTSFRVPHHALFQAIRPALPAMMKDLPAGSISLLVIGQAFSVTTMNINIIITGLSGLMIAPVPWLATMPLSLQFVTAMLTTLPASLLMGRFGRRPVFLFGIVAACIGSLGLGFGLVLGQFWLYLLSALVLGVAVGIAPFYRFAAADVVAPALKPKAIALVLSGGLLAAVAGPEITRRTVLLVPEVVYAGCFFTAAAIQLIPFVLLSRLKIPPPSQDIGEMRPLSYFLVSPRFIAGVLTAALGYGVMTFMMTAAPLQIVAVSGYSDSANASAIQWHVIAMFAPSFFTGSLIQRFGVGRVLLAGLGCYGCAVLLALNGETYWHYFTVLFLVGLGWNALFVGGSSVIADITRPQERGRIQGLTDFIVIGMVAVASLSAGALHYLVGWQGLILISLLPIALISLAVITLLAEQKKGPHPAS